MEKIIKVALTLFSLGLVGIGGFTLINLDLRTEITNEAPEPDPEATDNANYNRGLESMKKKDYEHAISSFTAISNNYSKINEVQNVLLECLVSYTNDIHQEVDELVSNPSADATSYTKAINLINRGLEYIDKLNQNDTTSSNKLNNDYSYVQLLIKIYKCQKDNKPFNALELYKKNENIFINYPSFIDFKNSIIEDCKDEISDIVNEYFYNNKYIDVINYINSLDADFVSYYQNDKKTAEGKLLNQIKNEVDRYIDKQDYIRAKQCVDTYYPYLKDYDDFIELYDKWHDYSDSKLIYKKITDESRTEKGTYASVDGNEYSEVILLSKSSDEATVEFALDKNYSNVNATIFLTNYNYNISDELVPLDILITDDQGNILNQYSNLNYKNPVNVSANINNIKFLRFTIKGKSKYVKIGIKDGKLS